MKRLLVTGISGFLGWHIATLDQAEWDITGVYHSNKPSLNTRMQQMDLTDHHMVEQFINALRPDAILHLAAASKTGFCEENVDVSFAINVEATKNLATICAKKQIPFVFTSTDLVFDGEKAPYKETDETSPICIYGEHKVLAEKAVREIYPAATIARMPLMYGKAASAPNFLTNWLKNLKEGKQVFAFSDEYRTCVSGYDAAKGLLLLLEKEVSGTWHLGGKERLSRYAFALQAAQYYGYSTDNLIASLHKDVNLTVRRSPDASLDSTKAFALGYAPQPLSDNLNRISIG